jgi:hypothetical protein
MPQLYYCQGQGCDYGPYQLDETIEYIRSKHQLYFIQRPNKVGVPDLHGHLWYCFKCDTRMGKGHRSYQTHKAMWDHLNHCHNYELPGVSLRPWVTPLGYIAPLSEVSDVFQAVGSLWVRNSAMKRTAYVLTSDLPKVRLSIFLAGLVLGLWWISL